MDTNLLRSWLGLPPGPWPPDDRSLLGLPAGVVDPSLAERRALELMGKLRPHQLVHPELVTEGMNRLAQALLAVTMGGTADPPPAPPAVIAPPPIPAPQPLPVPPPPIIAEPIPFLPEPVAPSTPPTQAKPLVSQPEPLPVIEILESPEVPEPVVGGNRADRRRAYRQLVGLRGLLRAWDRLRPTVADPSEQLLTPGRVFQYLDGVAAVRAATTHPGLEDHPLTELAPLVARIVLYPLPLGVFRSLISTQRVAVARDWALARSLLDARTEALRVSLRQSAPRPGAGRTIVRVAAFLARNPEWALVTTTVLLVAVAGVRAVSQSSE